MQVDIWWAVFALVSGFALGFILCNELIVKRGTNAS